MRTTQEQLRRAYYEGGGPVRPYQCSCGSLFAVSDERREHIQGHKRRKAGVAEVVRAATTGKDAP